MSVEASIVELLSRSKTSTKRLGKLADYIKLLLEEHGLPGAKGGSEGELQVPGLSRTKDWDVAYEYGGKFRLLVSLKSVLKNLSGAIPNRLDDLQGELANVQQMRPEVVIGYVVLVDVAQDTKRRFDGQYWSEYFETALRSIAIRKAPLWNQGLLEALWFVRFDSRRPEGSRVIDAERTTAEGTQFARALLCELQRREPAIPLTKDLGC